MAEIKTVEEDAADPCEGCSRWDDGLCDGVPEYCEALSPERRIGESVADRLPFQAIRGDEIMDVIAETDAVCARNRRDYEALAEMTGQSIAEIEADTCAPDFRPEEEL